MRAGLVLIAGLACGGVDNHGAPDLGEIGSEGGVDDAGFVAHETDGGSDGSSTGGPDGRGSDGSGSAFGCGDGVLDVGEVCDDGNLEDGDGCNADCTPSGRLLFWEAAAAGHVGQTDLAYGIAHDADGNAFVVGEVWTATRDRDAWIRKYDPDDRAVWTKTFDSPQGGPDAAIGVAADLEGNVYLAGWMANGAWQDIWVQQIQADGTPGWSDQHDGIVGDNDHGHAVAVDAAGNVVVTGFEGVGGQYYDVWVRRYRPDGAVAWTRGHSGPAAALDWGRGLAIADNGAIYVAGNETVAGEWDNHWLRRYDPDGNEVWTRTHNGTASLHDMLVDVAVGPDGAVYVCGNVHDSPVPFRAFVRKYLPDGSPVWIDESAGYAGEGAACQGIAVDSAGRIIVTGQERASATDWDERVYVRKYAADGEVLWTARPDELRELRGFGIDLSIGRDDEIHIAGTVDIGEDGFDVLFAHFTP